MQLELKEKPANIFQYSSHQVAMNKDNKSEAL